MSWTATITDLRPTPTGLEVVCVVTDGLSQKFQQCFPTDGTLANLLPQVRAVTVKVEAQRTKPDLTVGQTLDLTPPVPVTPPTPDAALVQFGADLRDLRREGRARADGLVTGQDLAALTATVQAALDKNPTYKALL